MDFKRESVPGGGVTPVVKIEFSPKEKEAIAHKDEWDLRDVPEELLPLATLYEYAREDRSTVEVFKKWHDTKLKLPPDAEGFKEWNGKTVFEVLEVLRTADDPSEAMPHDVWQAALDLQPPEFEWGPFNYLWDISFFFPKPFLEVLPGVLESQKAGHLRHILTPRKQIKAFKILDRFPTRSEQQIKWDEQMGIQYRVVKFDFRAGKTKLGKESAADSVALYCKHPPAKPIRQGAGARDYVPLKELGAYRLHKYGLRGEAANKFLTNYCHDSKNLERNNRLPIYESAEGGFFKAVKNAQKRIKQFADTGWVSSA